MSRRRFLKIAGVATGAATLTCVGGGYAATRRPDIETPELSVGEENAMSNRTLVTYATRAGSTAEIAAAIGESLAQRGVAVDVKPVKEQPDLSGYQVVLIGSAIRMGRWLPEAMEFIEANQTALNQLPVALFTVHMNNLGDDEDSRTARRAYLDAVRPLLDNAEEVYFAGEMDFSRLSFFDRLIAKAVGSVESDERDWDKIRAWVPAALVTEDA
ncbi:MAG: flavodoxin domain-containing protein [Anaerolineae bacterium]